MLESKNIVKRYGSTVALKNVSIRMEPGHIYAMLGPNGSGKTTWMKLATGLVRPDEGEMLFLNKQLTVESRKQIAYMSTEPYFYNWMTVEDVGRYYGDFFEDYDGARFSALLRRMELEGKMKVRGLSSGMMAKLKIAATLSRRASVYLLDEPLNGIDLLARDEILKSILEAVDENTVLCMSSHLVEEMEQVADEAVFIRNGVVAAAGNLDEMRKESGLSMADMYRKVYGFKDGEAEQ